MSAQDEEISAIGFLAHPAKSLIQIAAATHHGDAGGRLGLGVVFLANADVFVMAGVGRTAEQEKEWQQSKKTKQFLADGTIFHSSSLRTAAIYDSPEQICVRRS